MKKNISVTQLRLGMYIHKLPVPWLDHPFWCESFTLQKREHLGFLMAAGIDSIWIDTDRGLDVADQEDDGVDENDGAEEDGSETDDMAGLAGQPVATAPATMSPKQRRSNSDRERDRASKVLVTAKQAITSMFQEARMGNAVTVQDALPVVEEITASIARDGGTLIGLARLKTTDDYTYMHSVAVCALMVALSKECGLSADETLQAGLGGLLHDIGKVTIASGILQKPARLTQDEFDIMKSHPLAGYEILRNSGIDGIALDVCLHHHEKIDGSGYPHGLKGDEISRWAKMGAICDVYDAVTSNRPYKIGWTPGESLKQMAQWSHGHFDNRIFHLFVKAVGIYPVGSMVRMKSDHLGIVIDHNQGSLLKPRVKLFFSIKANTRIPVEIVDLSRPSAVDKILSHEDPARWNISNVDDIWRYQPSGN